MPKNYYIILGIPCNSSQEEIKVAYRRLAKEFHPDHYGENQSPFQNIQEAYSILSDPNSRKSYDNSLQPAEKVTPGANDRTVRRRPAEFVEPLVPDCNGGMGSNIIDESVYGSIFDRVFDQFLGGYADHRQPDRGVSRDVVFKIRLSSAQAELGGTVRLTLPLQIQCPSCYRYPRSRYTCWRCNGTGILKGERPVIIRYPPGISNNHTIKFTTTGYGNQQFIFSATFKVE